MAEIAGRLYRDTETGELVTISQLYEEYTNEPRECTFAQYIRNCLDKNGFLEEVKCRQ